MIASPGLRPRIGRRAFMSLLVLAVASASAVGAKILRDRVSTVEVLPNGSTPTVPPTPNPTEAWSVLPAAPISGRAGHTAVWTGTELIVWAGWDEAHEVEGLPNGAAFDPVKQTWRTIKPSPIAPRGRGAVVWTGDEVIVYGGVQWEGTIGDAGAYRPSTDTWRKLPASGLGDDRAGVAYAWTGDRFIVWGGTSGYAEPKNYANGAAYDPKTNTWTKIAAAPLSARLHPSFAWTGSELLVWGGQGDIVEGDGFSHPKYLVDGAAYDPSSDSWRKLPKAPIAGRYGERSFWTGKEMLVVGGERWDADGDVVLKDAAAFNPSSGSWRTFAWDAGDREDFPVVWTGTELVVWGGYRMVPEGEGFGVIPIKEGIAVDPSDGSIRTLPDAPIAARYGHAMAWLGDRLFIWSGIGAPTDSDDMLSDGATYDPN